MTDLEARESELVNVLKEGLDDAVWSAGSIGNRLLESSDRLRIDHDEGTFRMLSEEIGNLGCLVDLVDGLRKGANCLQTSSVGPDLFGSWGRSLALFQEMLSALERKDWILLADLIRYELRPVLEKGEMELAAFRKSLG